MYKSNGDFGFGERVMHFVINRVKHFHNVPVYMFAEATAAVEEAVSSDKFTMVIKDEGPPNGRKRRKPETVVTIEFPGYFVFTLKIDRTEGQGTYIIY